MRSLHPTRQLALSAVLGISIAVLAACSSSSSTPSGGSSSPTSQPTTPAATSSSSGGGSSAATSAITSNWEAFFSGSTSTTQKVALLQNGPAFASIIGAQAGSGMASSASAKVSSVTVNSTGTQAIVKYSIYLGGAPALPNQTGVAVYSGGKWLVGDASFCALLALENNGKAPSVCSSAG